MATNVRKKISELTALESASLDTVIVGVDNGTTYKIELDVLADAVTSRVNILDRSRLSSLESVTSSFETKGRSVVSSSAQITALGFVSTSIDISELNSYTSSQSTLNTAFTNGINARLQTSSFNEFSASVHSEIVAATNEQSFNGLISGSSQLTSSYDSRYVLSGSITQTTWDNISGKPSGLVSQSTDLTPLTSKTGSYATTGSNIFIGNQTITGSVSILIPGGTAYAINENPTPNNEFWAYVVQYPDAQNVAVGWTATIVGGGTYTVTAVNYQHPFNKITLSDGSLTMGYRIGINFSKSSKLWEFNSNGTLTGLPDGLVSGSSQLTSSYDSRYLVTGSITSSINQLNTFTASISTASLVDRLNTIESVTSSYEIKGSGILSGSVSYLDLTNIPSGIVSQSTDLTPLNNFTASISTASLVSSISNLNQFTASQSTSSLVDRLNTIESVSGSWITESETGSLQTSITNLNTFTASQSTASLVTSITQLNTYTASVSTASLVTSIAQLNTFTASVSTASLVTSITQLNTYTASVSTASLVISINNLNTFTASQSTASLVTSINNLNTQTASLESRLATIGTQSGSWGGASSLTSLNTFSASINSYTASANTWSGGVDTKFTSIATITGSLILSASADSNKFTTLATYTSSLNIWTSSVATTGSNSFNGNQTITGSLNVSSIAVVSSSFTANSSSLTLNSGSNLYVQNNGLVEITGSLVVSGSVNIITTSPLQIGTGSGDEGGEILLAKAATNSTLTGSGITIDSYRDRLRIFEQGGDARGVYIDLAKTPTGVSGELIWKASGIVNAGTFVTLDNLKATVTTSGNRGLGLATVAGTITGYASAQYQQVGIGTNGSAATISLSTSVSTSILGYNFTGQGDTTTFIIRDDTNSRVYRIIMIIGGSYNNNFISIERLY